MEVDEMRDDSRCSYCGELEKEDSFIPGTSRCRKCDGVFSRV